MNPAGILKDKFTHTFKSITQPNVIPMSWRTDATGGYTIAGMSFAATEPATKCEPYTSQACVTKSGGIRAIAVNNYPDILMANQSADESSSELYQYFDEPYMHKFVNEYYENWRVLKTKVIFHFNQVRDADSKVVPYVFGVNKIYGCYDAETTLGDTGSLSRGNPSIIYSTQAGNPTLGTKSAYEAKDVRMFRGPRHDVCVGGGWRWLGTQGQSGGAIPPVECNWSRFTHYHDKWVVDSSDPLLSNALYNNTVQKTYTVDDGAFSSLSALYSGAKESVVWFEPYCINMSATTYTWNTEPAPPDCVWWAEIYQTVEFSGLKAEVKFEHTFSYSKGIMDIMIGGNVFDNEDLNQTVDPDGNAVAASAI